MSTNGTIHKTMVKIHECYDESRPMPEVLRDIASESILLDDDPRLPELIAIRETLLENDECLDRLCELNPNHSEAYHRQWEYAESELDQRVAKLNIKSL